jgi:hypothetical protein
MRVNTMMPAAVQTQAAPPLADRRSSFYVWLSLAVILIAVGGFARTYLIPVATGQFHRGAIVHVHGLLFFGWTLLLAVQTLFVGRRRVNLHRAAGMLGIALATAMVFTTLVLIVRGLSYSVAIGNYAAARTASIVPITQIALFAAFVAGAIARVRRPDVHRRLMVLATANLLPAPIARIFGAVVAPTAPRLANIGAIPNPNTALIAGTVAAGVVDLLLLAIMIRDWKSSGRLHRAYALGLGVMALIQALRIPSSTTAPWQWITDALLALSA